ncbi:DUF488 domain-containing protein [Salinibacterium sp. SWN1162]|uniref:DUF488 domain-containing protein n=1 Tax=Salinibacterium sp. SWN1162 TaxID=2792053 RepID=UPI0018CE899E|nr:DUF488 family protein [Salinibacterium sp. SWN1162]MBH0010227.1 DUF488 family protein [Salinibacterium sp. SWN1162]
MTDVTIARIYEQPRAADGFRVLVDRLWPRGVSKRAAQVDEWNKDLAPSTALRIWWNHDADMFDDFATRYRAELDERLEVAAAIEQLRTHHTVTLLYAARDPEINHAIILRDYVLRALAVE